MTKLWRVKWSPCPTAYNTPQVSFVEAESADDARALTKDYIERRLGVEWYAIAAITEYTPPQVKGRVLELNEHPTGDQP